MLHVLHAVAEGTYSFPEVLQEVFPQVRSVDKAEKRLVINGDKYLLPSLLYCNRFQGCDF